MPNPNDADEYEKFAEAARRLAENCHGEEAQFTLRQIAEKYEGLARQARAAQAQTAG